MDSKMGYESREIKDIEIDKEKEEEYSDSEKECTICFINDKDTILPCEHKVCEKCYKNIETCPFCRIKINKPNTCTIVSIELQPSTSTQVQVDIPVTVDSPCKKLHFCTMILIMLMLASVGPITWFGYGLVLFRNK